MSNVLSDAGIRYEQLALCDDLLVCVKADVEAAARRAMADIERERNPKTISVREARVLAAQKMQAEILAASDEMQANANLVVELKAEVERQKAMILDLQEKASKAKLYLPAGASESYALLKEMVAA